MTGKSRDQSSFSSRRQFVRATAGFAGASVLGLELGFAQSNTRNTFRLATFSADVTVPLGHALMGGGIAPAKTIGDPLTARGFVLLGGELPVVLVSVEWCEIRNDAHDRWRAALAEAAGTKPERVFVTSTHVHDAPVADLEAQRILSRHQTGVNITDLAFHEQAVQRVAAALREGLKNSKPVTHLGLGQARVLNVASNRRYVREDGTPTYGRMSRATDTKIREAPEGTIDPFLKTISFWNGGQPLLALHSYATHPMSHYGQGEVSSDFPGLALRRRQAGDAKIFQIYASGCSGNVTAGKYNDGTPENRVVLAERIHQGMADAWRNTTRLPLEQIAWRAAPLRLEPRGSAGFTVEEMKKVLLVKDATPFSPFAKCKAAMGLSWRQRADASYRLDVPVLDFGPAQIILLPAECYVEFQLFAQNVRPDSFVMALGYGECAPGYIPIEKAWQENDSNLRDWCWVAPGAETAMKEAIHRALKGG
ncbi:MAG: hypothetical protein HZA89_02600 [Verrucomicrobia bacterium]|nr:hypothetical protein [Verrucomicrobiota bacterium]